MIITFTSIINMPNNDEPQKIEFSSDALISEEGVYTVYEFAEPSRNVMNRIEISPTQINIFAGPSSINLSLEERLEMIYETGVAPILLTSYLKSIRFDSKNLTNFNYQLYNNDDLIGDYSITITIH